MKYRRFWQVKRLLLKVFSPFRVGLGFIARASDRARHGWEDSFRRVELLHPIAFAKSPDLLEPSCLVPHSFSEKHVWIIRNGIFHFSQGVVYLKGAGVAESTSWQPSRRIRLRPIQVVGARRAPVESPVASVSQHRWNYYHWLIEDLPPLLYLHRTIPDLTVYVGRGAPNFVISSLNFYGVDYLMARGLLRVPELAFVGRGNDTGWPHPWDIKQVRVDGPANRQGRKLYISRRHSSRSPKHEADLEFWLAQRGFEIFFLEALSFESQIQLFSETSLLVAQHGAGLANLVFAPKGIQVVEIFERTNVNQCFERLSAICGHVHEGVIFDRDDDAASVIVKVRKVLEAAET